jgi:hypothetical protein
MAEDGKKMMRAVGTVFGVALLITFVALVIQTILNLDAFTSVAIINTTSLTNAIGAFLTGLWAFFGLAGTVISIVWVVSYIKDLFDKKQGLGAITA